jgi:hypothetical protein
VSVGDTSSGSGVSVGDSGVSVGGGGVGLGGTGVSVAGGGVSASGAGVGLGGGGASVAPEGVGDGTAATSPSVGGTRVVTGPLQNVNPAVTNPRITSQTKTLAIVAFMVRSFLVFESRG